MTEPLLSVRDLRTHFFTDDGVVRAVEGISFELAPRETLGIVGESGSGKSVTALSILRLVSRPGRIVSGSVRFGGEDLLALPEDEMRDIRGAGISMIFQEPMTSLNPVFSVGDQIAEVFTIHQGKSREDALKAVPDGYREAAEAMGATKWQVVWRVLLPAARNGLLAAVLLGVARSIGETMGALMATGHAVTIPHSPFDSVRTLTATIAAELGETSRGGEHYQALFVIGMLLFSVTFVVNVTADLVIRGWRKR